MCVRYYRYSGQSTQLSIRKTRSQWELAQDDGEDAGCIVLKQKINQSPLRSVIL
jgi:hypothetical protein